MQNNAAVQYSATEMADFQHKKQSIYLALCQVLTREQAAVAIDNWVQHVSASSSLFHGLNLFAQKICKTYGEESRQNELARAMSLALMTGASDDLTNDAAPVLASDRPKQVIESRTELLGPEISTPEFASFQSLLLALLHKLAERDNELGSSCRKFILQVVDNLPWTPEQQAQVINVVNTGLTAQIRPYRTGQLKTLMHHIGVWMNDVLGLEASELVRRHAIGAVELSAVGKAYSPASFFAK